MQTIIIAISVALLYIIAYHTYGKFLAKKLFSLNNDQPTPAHQLRDDIDYCPASREILFGHHFTSIAGTGPIVGPAIAVIWGWLPALLWVLIGSILMGAIHDFGSIVISSRYQGRSIGDIAREVINPRVRILFLLVIFFALIIVIAIFGLVIAVLFQMYPASVIPVWIELPIAILLGWLVYRKGLKALPLSLIGVAILYAAIYYGTQIPIQTFNNTAKDHTHLIVQFGTGQNATQLLTIPTLNWLNPVAFWTIILLIYAYIASVLPVWQLLQPRDYLNSHQLLIALGLLILGIIYARPELVAPIARSSSQIKGAPPIWPFLFITIACGAISGFHCMVGSGTTSKQLSKHTDALPIGFGGMLLEGMLATLVILACCAGFGMATNGSEGGLAAWNAHYSDWNAAQGLPQKVSAFVEGSANMIATITIPFTKISITHQIATTLMAVFVVSFAATTLDTATRLQRYVISELANTIKFKPLINKHGATLLAVTTAAALALGVNAPGKAAGTGGLILWPLFGATNQLLACLALLVITIWLKRTGRPIQYTLTPMIFMMIITAWAMTIQLKNFATTTGQLHLLIIGATIFLLQIWIIIESAIILLNAPPLTEKKPEKA